MPDRWLFHSAREAALKAGRYLLDSTPTLVSDSPKDVLTVADLESERIIREVLKGFFPKISFVGEESDSGFVSSDDGLWVVDPVDGTGNYLHGLDHWGISIALVVGDRSEVSLIFLPAKGQMFHSIGNEASFMVSVGEHGYLGKAVSISVSHEDRSAKPLVLIDWPKEQHDGRDHDLFVEMVRRIDSKFHYPLVLNSSTANLMLVATGKASGFIHLRPDRFDISAGCRIVEQAGGKVTDLEGKPWSPLSPEKGIVASNGVIHSELLAVVNA